MWEKSKRSLSKDESFGHNVANILAFCTTTTIYCTTSKKLPTYTHLFFEQPLHDLHIFKRAGGNWWRHFSGGETIFKQPRFYFNRLLYKIMFSLWASLTKNHSFFAVCLSRGLFSLPCKSSLLNCAPTRLKYHWYAPYPSLIRAFTLINKRLTRVCLVLCCVLQLKGKVTNTYSPPVSLSSLLFYQIKLFYMLFSFFYLKPLVTLSFIQLFCNNIFRFSVLVFFWNKLNKHPNFTHLTLGQIL